MYNNFFCSVYFVLLFIHKNGAYSFKGISIKKNTTLKKKKKKKTFEDFRQKVFLNLFLIKKATTNVGQPGNNVLFLLHEFLCMSFNIRVIFFFFFHKA